MHRVWVAAIVALAVGVFGAAGYLVLHKTTVTGAGTLPDYSSGAPAPTSVPATVTAPPVIAGSPVVAFLGDDYTLGTGASTPAHRFTTLVAASLHAIESNFGVAGTGYAKSSGAQRDDYGSRVADVEAAKPAVVVVSGGRNDATDDLDTFAATATTLFSDLHSALPSAKIIALSPMWGDTAAPAALSTIASAVDSAVSAIHGTYLAITPDPLFGHPSFMADENDPNDAGYQSIATAVTPKLAPYVPKPATATPTAPSRTPSSTPKTSAHRTGGSDGGSDGSGGSGTDKSHSGGGSGGGDHSTPPSSPHTKTSSPAPPRTSSPPPHSTAPPSTPGDPTGSLLPPGGGG